MVMLERRLAPVVPSAALAAQVPSQVAPSARYIDTQIRESDVTAVDTWTTLNAFAGTTEGDYDVPSQAGYLAGLQISVGFDGAAAAAGLRTATAVRLTGNGLRHGGNHRYLGPCCTFIGVGANYGAMSLAPTVVYPLNVPVVGGNKIKVEAINLGEQQNQTSVVKLLYSDQPAPGGFMDGDIREGDLTAVDTDYPLTAIGAEALGHFRVPQKVQDRAVSRLSAIRAAIAWDVGTALGGTRAVGAARLLGDGLAVGGSYRLTMPGLTFGVLGTGGGLCVSVPEEHRIGIPVVAGNSIEGHVWMLGELPVVGGTGAIGLLWGA